MMTDRIYIGTDGQQPGIGIVDCQTGQTETLVLPTGNSVCAMDVCLADKILTCGTKAGYGRIYSVSSFGSLEELPCLYVGRPVIGIAAYPGFKIFTQDATGRVISWRLDRQIRFTILPQKQVVRIIVKLANGLLAGIGDNLIQIWDIATEELIGQSSLPQENFPTGAVFWSQYNLLVISGRSGLHFLDINDGSYYEMPDCISGDWRLFTAAGNLYSLETQSGVLYRKSDPQTDAEQTMLCRGITDVAMAGRKVVVIDGDGHIFQYAISIDGVQYAGQLPWENCHVVRTAIEFEQTDYQQKAKAAQISQIRSEYDRAISRNDNHNARQLVKQLDELGEKQDADLLRLNLARSCDDIADEMMLLSRMINYIPKESSHSIAARYLELLVQTGQLEQAFDVHGQFNFPDYLWLEGLRDAIADGECVIEPDMLLSKLIKVYRQLDIQFNGTFILNRCRPMIIPDAKIIHIELANKLSEIAASKSIGMLTEQTLKLHYQAGNEVSTIDTLTLAALEVSESYVLIPSLRFIRQDSGTMIERTLFFSAYCQNEDSVEHNNICLRAIERLEQNEPESFWPDYLCEIISEALMRLKNSKHAKKIKLGGLHG